MFLYQIDLTEKDTSLQEGVKTTGLGRDNLVYPLRQVSNPWLWGEWLSAHKNTI